MVISMLIGGIFIFLMHLFRSKKKNKKEEYNHWGLGVDCCTYYSKPFSIRNSYVTITGFQEVLGEGKAIRYSLVKKNWWGRRIVIGNVNISESYRCFTFTFKDIPNDSNYQIEVFNRFNLSCGHFKVIEEYDNLHLAN